MYRAPYLLKEHYPLFEQRWELRDQYQEIIRLMETHEAHLQKIQPSEMKYASAQVLLQEMADFKIWSWREVDREDFFYKKIEEFDRRAFMIS